jgi:ASTRA-associated protein 1
MVQVDIFCLPNQGRLFTVNPAGAKGMSMALAIFQTTHRLHLVVGYEGGLATVSRFDPARNTWDTVYQHQAHTQPVLALDVSPTFDFFLTSSADAILAKHPIPGLGTSETLVSNAKVPFAPATVGSSSVLSATLASASSSLTSASTPPSAVVGQATTPLKVVNTKHAGQQSIRIRSDGTIFATAGWDSRVRVYSAKTMKEVAVLKWHTVGCFAAAFSSILEEMGDVCDSVQLSAEGGGDRTELLSPGMTGLTVKERRIRQARTAHWLAAGAKDGKISLWDIF